MPRFSNIDSNFHVSCRCFNSQWSQWTEQKWMLTFLEHWPGSGRCIRVWHLCSGCKLAACHHSGTYENVRYRADGAWDGGGRGCSILSAPTGVTCEGDLAANIATVATRTVWFQAGCHESSGSWLGDQPSITVLRPDSGCLAVGVGVCSSSGEDARCDNNG